MTRLEIVSRTQKLITKIRRICLEICDMKTKPRSAHSKGTITPETKQARQYSLGQINITTTSHNDSSPVIHRYGQDVPDETGYGCKDNKPHGSNSSDNSPHCAQNPSPPSEQPGESNSQSLPLPLPPPSPETLLSPSYEPVELSCSGNSAARRNMASASVGPSSRYGTGIGASPSSGVLKEVESEEEG